MTQALFNLFMELDTNMAALTFETREVLLTLEQRGNEDRAPIISIKLKLSSTPPVYAGKRQNLAKAQWMMIVRELQPGDDDSGGPGSVTYSDSDGKPECRVMINHTPDRFHNLIEMFKGGTTSEIAIELDGLQRRDDYSSDWDNELQPKLNVLRVSFEFPLPQNEA